MGERNGHQNGQLGGGNCSCLTQGQEEGNPEVPPAGNVSPILWGLPTATCLPAPGVSPSPLSQNYQSACPGHHLVNHPKAAPNAWALLLTNQRFKGREGPGRKVTHQRPGKLNAPPKLHCSGNKQTVGFGENVTSHTYKWGKKHHGNHIEGQWKAATHGHNCPACPGNGNPRWEAPVLLLNMPPVPVSLSPVRCRKPILPNTPWLWWEVMPRKVG